MALPHVSPVAFRRTSGLTLAALGLIVVTGGAVRLTGSGLGCSSWPGCTPGSFTPELSLHPLVEFGNRLVSALVGVSVLATVLAAWRRVPRRRDLIMLSLGLVAGYLGQGGLGALSVIFHLSPVLVMAHFLLSMVLLLDAFMLWTRAGEPPGPRRPLVRREVVLLARGLAVGAAVVLVLGTVVTGTGPHSGGESVDRLPFRLESVAQLHSDAVLFLIGLTVALAVVLRIVNAPDIARRRCRLLLLVMLGQATVGFAQFFLGLPRGLVAVHIAGATAFWLSTLALVASLSAPTSPAPTEVRLPHADRDLLADASRH